LNKPKHGARRARAAAKALGQEPPPLGKKARLALSPPRPTVTWIIGTPKLATTPVLQVPTALVVEQAAPPPDPRSLPIEDLDFPPIVWSRLKTHGINSAGDLSDYSKKIPLIASKRRGEIATKLAALGLPCNLPE
jgi:hypothetical protein